MATEEFRESSPPFAALPRASLPSLRPFLHARGIASEHSRLPLNSLTDANRKKSWSVALTRSHHQPSPRLMRNSGPPTRAPALSILWWFRRFGCITGGVHRANSVRRRCWTCAWRLGVSTPSCRRIIAADTVTIRWRRSVERTRNPLAAKSGVPGVSKMSVGSSVAGTVLVIKASTTWR